MRVEILDYNTFGAVDPIGLRRYLAINGWSQIREVEDDIVVMSKPTEDGRHRLVWLPISRELSDYELMVAKLVSAVAETDHKSQIQVMDDLETVGIGDVVRGGTEDFMNRHGHTLPIDEGERLLHRLRQVIVAGASSVVERRPVYSYNSFGEVRAFIRSLRLAQTEQGSYLMRIIAPIEPVIATPEEIAGQMLLNERLGMVPFARRAVLQTLKAVGVLHDVASQNLEMGRFSFPLFRDAVPTGVSANLCEAITASGKDELESPIEISVTWSYIVTGTETLPTKFVRFEPEMMQFIRQAGREFRRTSPLTAEMQGWVSMMGRAGTRTGPGKIRLIGRVDGRIRSVQIDLEEDDYRIAANAHREGMLISVSGDIVVENNRYTMTRPRNLQIVVDSGLFNQDDLVNEPQQE